MQSKLTIYGGRVVDVDPIEQVALAENRKIEFVIFATKNLPSHFNITVGGNAYRSGRRFFSDRRSTGARGVTFNVRRKPLDDQLEQ